MGNNYQTDMSLDYNVLAQQAGRKQQRMRIRSMIVFNLILYWPQTNEPKFGRFKISYCWIWLGKRDCDKTDKDFPEEKNLTNKMPKHNPMLRQKLSNVMLYEDKTY